MPHTCPVRRRSSQAMQTSDTPQDHAQAGRPWPDQRVPQSSLASTENTSSETVREFWHGTSFPLSPITESPADTQLTQRSNPPVRRMSRVPALQVSIPVETADSAFSILSSLPPSQGRPGRRAIPEGQLRRRRHGIANPTGTEILTRTASGALAYATWTAQHGWSSWSMLPGSRVK